MAFMYVHGPCVNCRTPLSYNANHVPAIRVNGRVYLQTLSRARA